MGNNKQDLIKSIMENIRATLEKINHQTFENIVNSLFKARKMYIIGLRGPSALSEFLVFYSNLLR